MPEALSRLQQQFVDFWRNLDKSQKNRIYITSGILVVAITIGIILLTRPSYMVLIKSSDSKEIGEMVKILTDEGIWNKVSNDQKSITINTKDNNKAQAALVQKGYPKSVGLTFDDAFSMIKITTTDSEKRKIWEKEEESSIAAKLKAMDSIDDASVDLALPEPTLFVANDAETRKTTASVMIKPKGDFNEKQVQGVVMMVAHSVENLDPKNVTVVDSNLRILNSETGDDAIDSANNQDEMTRKKAEYLEKKVYDMFNGAFDNFDSIRVVANPVLDFDKQKQLTNGIKPPDGLDGAGAPLTVDKKAETLKDAVPGGAPGTDTNPGTTPSYPITSSAGSTYDNKEEKITYGWTQYQLDQEKALGLMNLDRSSMTVTLLYGKRVTDETKLSQAFIDQFKKDVSTATGIDVSKISVNKYKIAPPEVVKEQWTDVLKRLVDTYGFFALMLLLIIGLMIMAIPRKKKVTEPEPIPALQGAGATTGPRFIVPEIPGEPLPDIEFEERSEVKKQIDKFVKQKPEAVAQLLRNWLSEEWD